jgi:hypothetical protein
MSFGEMSEYLLLFPVARAWLALALPCMEDAPKDCSGDLEQRLNTAHQQILPPGSPKQKDRGTIGVHFNATI